MRIRCPVMAAAGSQAPHTQKPAALPQCQPKLSLANVHIHSPHLAARGGTSAARSSPQLSQHLRRQRIAALRGQPQRTLHSTVVKSMIRGRKLCHKVSRACWRSGSTSIRSALQALCTAAEHQAGSAGDTM